MKKFSFKTRQQNLAALPSVEFDLLIIGGGITGAGAARDASARGMKVALVEASDFASGTSSRSSKLIHGGIRYLENMEFGLVFEALNERTKLFAMAPHLVHPLRFMLPLYKSSRVGMFKMGLGMWLYDALSLFQTPEMHERLSAKESLERMPAIQPQDLEGSFVYSDAYMDDDRLVHETLRAANENGAVCVNYVKAVGASFDADGKIHQVQCKDVLGSGEFSIRAKHIISSVGPWTDQLGSQIIQNWKSILRPTKGIHLTLPKDRLPLTSAVVMAAEKSNRIVFGIPRHEMIIIGTTDTDFKESPEKVEATPEDVRYLLKIVDDYFPGAKLTENDIIASYAGVRPLVHDGSENEGKTSREHVIFTDPAGVTFVAGGKYTTYRLMAEQVVEEALKYFSIEDKVRFANADTTLPLSPYTSVDAFTQAQGQAAEIAHRFGKTLPEAKLLVERYGMEAELIFEANPGAYSYWQLEAAQAIENTMCLHLVDFWTRRVPLFLAEKDHGLSVLEDVAAVFAERLGWSSNQLANEKKSIHDYISKELAWKGRLP